MSYKSVFRRYEIKYLLSPEQKQIILEAIDPFMRLDSYGRTTIRNVYLDTDNFRLIRRSIEKPMYKEKLRVRSYSRAEEDSMVFVELKKKYDHVVYKRRVALPEREAMLWVTGQSESSLAGQIPREIDYFMHHYGPLYPSVFLSYEREALYERGGGDLRITFDDNILARRDNLSLCADTGGEAILPADRLLMEIKCSGAIPLWLVKVLSRERIYKTPFSKYGRAYMNMILPEIYTDNKKEIISNV